jgi:DNA-directed RNA polymerase subunit N (RpoN/RPB10)
MSLPVRCFTCNKIIGQYEERFVQALQETDNIKEILDSFNLTRYCCRRMFLGYVPVLDKQLVFPQNINEKSDSISKNNPTKLNDL